MRHTARLQHIKRAISFTVQFNVAHKKPGVHDGRNLNVGSLDRLSARRQVRQKSRHAPLLQEIDQANEHGVRIALVSRLDQAADWIKNDHSWLEILNDLVNNRQVHFQSIERGPAGMKLQKVFLRPLFQVQADRSHIANQLARRFLERKIEATLAAPPSGVNKVRRETSLAGSGRS